MAATNYGRAAASTTSAMNCGMAAMGTTALMNCDRAAAANCGRRLRTAELASARGQMGFGTASQRD
jgi:hypothetical protein